MPMFDFACTACGKQFEDLVFDDACPACPECGQTTQRQVSAPSPLKTGAFPYSVGPVHPAASRTSNLNVGCPSAGGFK